MKRIWIFTLVVVFAFSVGGCFLPKGGDNTLVVPAPLSEPAWIRNGEPIQFEGEQWFPTDEVEAMMDNELYQAGTYRNEYFFIDQKDVRPFDRLYTRFSKNHYRAFEKRE